MKTWLLALTLPLALVCCGGESIPDRPTYERSDAGMGVQQDPVESEVGGSLGVGGSSHVSVEAGKIADSPDARAAGGSVGQGGSSVQAMGGSAQVATAPEVGGSKPVQTIAAGGSSGTGGATVIDTVVAAGGAPGVGGSVQVGAGGSTVTATGGSSGTGGVLIIAAGGSTGAGGSVVDAGPAVTCGADSAKLDGASCSNRLEKCGDCACGEDRVTRALVWACQRQLCPPRAAAKGFECTSTELSCADINGVSCLCPELRVYGHCQLQACPAGVNDGELCPGHDGQSCQPRAGTVCACESLYWHCSSIQ